MTAVGYFGDVERVAADESEPAHAADEARTYRDILAKHDDRLIRDIGRTREELLGPEKAFWSEWLKVKAPWQL
jgi:hypothetical protein